MWKPCFSGTIAASHIFSGTVSERILREIWNDICHKDRRRMFLITDNDTVTRSFRKKGAETGRRVEYEYAGKVLGFPDDCFMPCFIGMGRPKKEEKPVRQVEINPGNRIHWNRY